ncbi:Transcriptional regulator, TetR family [Mesorhizobium metallidurans STM 2683]|uniref:Transcriptional regulator, TetR family n=1 Tax=Mesorhizobium metallidurans STM 2683 TaxID=1297569 RepID=M5EGX3_9HYPH|nr:transcriptional regulator BetI [Mesorhizobium metallidurans]CCV03515.1 Transcriptional regulator, TetR family [Mesorhizobium metallidurans STM 2683]
MATQRKRTKIEDIRRIELIAAAHRVFLENGLQGMTSARICREAGMSPGILAYYFKGKDEVLFGMVRYNNRLLMEDVIARLRAARTAWARLEAIVEGNFPASAFTRPIANAWLSVCAEAGVNPQYARLQRLFYQRLRSNLASVFDGMFDATRLRHASLVIAALIDGLWLRKAATDDVGRDEAITLVLSGIRSLLNNGEEQLLRRPTEREPQQATRAIIDER